MQPKTFLLAAALGLALAGTPPAQAVDAPTVWLDGEQLTFDVQPTIQNDRTMVPYRAIFEELGYTVSWNAQARSVSAIKDGASMWMQIGNPNVTVNGKNVVSDAAPVIQGDRTLVPLRLVSEYSGCDVLWDSATRTVAMYRKQAINAASQKQGFVTTDGDSLLVMHNDCNTLEFGTQGYSLVDLSPIAFLQGVFVNGAYNGIGYGQILRSPMINEDLMATQYFSMDMVTGEILAVSEDKQAYWGHAIHIDPVTGTPYIASGYYNYSGCYNYYAMRPDTLQTEKTFITDYDMNEYFAYDGKLWIVDETDEYMDQNVNEVSEDIYRLRIISLDCESGETSQVFETSYMESQNADCTFYGNELYVALRDEIMKTSTILIYNVDTSEMRTILLPDLIDALDVNQNSIFYLADSELGSGPYGTYNALYRISKDGNLRIRLQDRLYQDPGLIDSFANNLKVVGNTIYYYVQDVDSEYSTGGTNIVSLCALPTCGGTPYIMEKSIWWRGATMS